MFASLFPEFADAYGYAAVVEAALPSSPEVVAGTPTRRSWAAPAKSSLPPLPVDAAP